MYTTAQVFCLASLCGQTKHKEYVSQGAFSCSAQFLLCPLYNKHSWRFGPSLFQLSFCCCLLAKTGFSMGVHTEYKWTCHKPHGYYWNTFLHGNIHLCCLGIMEASKLKDFFIKAAQLLAYGLEILRVKFYSSSWELERISVHVSFNGSSRYSLFLFYIFPFFPCFVSKLLLFL